MDSKNMRFVLLALTVIGLAEFGYGIHINSGDCDVRYTCPLFSLRYLHRPAVCAVQEHLQLRTFIEYKDDICLARDLCKFRGLKLCYEGVCDHTRKLCDDEKAPNREPPFGQDRKPKAYDLSPKCDYSVDSS